MSKKTVIIRLLEESGKATMSWTIENAWPVKLSETEMTLRRVRVGVRR